MRKIVSIVSCLFLIVLFQNCEEIESIDGSTQPSKIEDPVDLAASNREIVFKRVMQFASLKWTPKLAVPAESTGGSLYIAADVEFSGPPYSSVKTLGRVINQDMSYETFLSMVDNEESDLYHINLQDHPLSGKTGRTAVGAVCSNFLAFGFNWPFSPTTSMIDREHEKWGFKSRIPIGTWGEGDVNVGDVLVTEGGGHIELIVGVTETEITTLDQAKRGPRFTSRERNVEGGGFYAYAIGRNYNLYRYDYTAMGKQVYTPSDYAPLEGETPAPVSFNQVVKLNKGTRSAYASGETAKIYIPAEDAARLVVKRNGFEVINIPVVGNGQVVEQEVTVPGDYEVYCIMDDASESERAYFAVTNVTASISTNTAKTDENVTVIFSTENSTAEMLIVEDVQNNSVSRGIIRSLTAEEINAGRVVFKHTYTGDFRVRIRALNPYGAAYSEDLDLMPLTITN